MYRHTYTLRKFKNIVTGGRDQRLSIREFRNSKGNLVLKSYKMYINERHKFGKLFDSVGAVPTLSNTFSSGIFILRKNDLYS